MVEPRPYEFHFKAETLTANATIGVPGHWNGTLDPIADVAHHVASAQLFVKINNGGASAPVDPDVTFRVQFNLGDDLDDVAAGDWTDLFTLNRTATGLAKSTVYTDPIPRRIRLAREITFTTPNDGWTLEAWIVCGARVGR